MEYQGTRQTLHTRILYHAICALSMKIRWSFYVLWLPIAEDLCISIFFGTANIYKKLV